MNEMQDFPKPGRWTEREREREMHRWRDQEKWDKLGSSFFCWKFNFNFLETFFVERQNCSSEIWRLDDVEWFWALSDSTVNKISMFENSNYNLLCRKAQCRLHYSKTGTIL